MSGTAGEQEGGYTIKIAQTTEEVQACYDMRVEVFVVEHGFQLEDEIDEYDPQSLQFLLTIPTPSPTSTDTSSLLPQLAQSEHSTTAVPVGTVRYTPSIGKISRLAVLKSFRGKGYSVGLMRAAEEYVRKHRGRVGDSKKEHVGDDLSAAGEVESSTKEHRDSLYLHAQIYVVPYYRKLGYEPEGDVFDECGEPHQKMVKYLN
ncbi:hypothetical protein TREMEDRAFT_72590 [Tremella mesenterica DSM 1558]|uniref:uncharacterized protein n=1 Tax=Tremella mesenterica (strain ATCC 24925 / CBS 8224 / DSM 1558 / NBRC 9311 / NRRL Y-6157 / RJB 2259-6 / UBC 559-6) TaxID=578456 RepID=UPI00032BA97F|nr:uncharacterized protein TREMEDRAFT_72590 [Tremella mesenterica DSM 1558]EIW65479.1 hypothetical protein TREMEDRAFT_72590 [Tremella mesenterica DSM 1558]